jgi:hypothetical protein
MKIQITSDFLTAHTVHPSHQLEPQICAIMPAIHSQTSLETSWCYPFGLSLPQSLNVKVSFSSSGGWRQTYISVVSLCNRTVPSCHVNLRLLGRVTSLPVANKKPFGAYETQWTGPWWPLMSSFALATDARNILPSCFPVSYSWILTQGSADPPATSLW